MIRLTLLHRCFLTAFDKTNDQESWNPRKSEKTTIGFCSKISSDFTVQNYLLPYVEFWSLSVSCLTISLFRKTSMIEWRIVSNWNRGDTSWKRSFTCTLKLGKGMFLRSLRKYFTLTAYLIILSTVIFLLFYICPSSLSTLPHCVFI